MTTIARPYAKAVYGLAEQKDSLVQWHDWLQKLKPLLEHRAFLEDLLHPSRSREAQVNLLMQWVGDESGVLRRFLSLLAERRRLAALPAICDQFQAQVASAQKRLHVRIVSAFELSDALKDRLVKHVARKWDASEVEAVYSIDPSLLGGIEVSTQDGSRVWRLSIRHRLEQLKAVLLS